MPGHNVACFIVRGAMNSSKLILLVLITFSLLVGACVFYTSAYRDSTLNIDATSMEKGVGTVFFEGTGLYRSSSRNFEINEYQGDEGLKKLYVIEFPATRLHTLRIEPRIRSGLFDFDRIILANATISYTWDEQGVCSRKMQGKGVHKQQPCIEGAPFLKVADNSSILITAIPETGFINNLETRIIKALVLAFGTFLGGAWLLWPCDEKQRTVLLSHYAVKLSWLALAMLFVYQLFLVSRYSVDVPRQDEWMYFRSDGLIKGLTWQWLFGFHSEHPLSLTKLLAWLNMKLFGLDFVLQNIFNFFIFGGLLAAVTVFKNLVLGREAFKLFPLFLIFLLSPINYENHLWALQSNYHLVLLFSILMLSHAFRSELTIKSALIFCLYAFLAMLTYSAGVIFVAVYLICVSVYTVAGIIEKRIDCTTGWRFLLIVCSFCGVSLWLFFFGREASPSLVPLVYPSCFKFWDFLLNVISFGFGFKQVHILPGAVCLILVVLPPGLLLIKKETRWLPSTWLVLSAVLGILAVLAAISIGRAWIYPAKTSRYVEIAFLLIPYTALGWWLVMKEGYARLAMLSLLLIFCFVSFFDDWSTKGYALYNQFSLYDLEDVEAYYSGTGEKICPELSTPSDLDRAKSLDIKFTRQFK